MCPRWDAAPRRERAPEAGPQLFVLPGTRRGGNVTSEPEPLTDPGVPETWPEDAVAALMRALGRYLRESPAVRLPPTVRRFHGFRQSALGPHRARLLAALAEPGARARIAEWLDGGPRLAATEREVLRTWAERPGGWERREAAEGEPVTSPPGADEVRDDVRDELLRREQDRTKKARADARRARTRERWSLEAARGEIERLAGEVEELTRRAERAESEARAEASERQRTAAAHERELRRARRAEARAKAERDRARAEAKAARRELAARERAAEAEGGRAARRSEAPRPGPVAAGPRRRRPLPVPLGLLEEDPETLTRWLRTPGVRLLVDGYNVSKSEQGFGRLELEDQRRRTVDEVARLARKHGVPATVVFDGSEVPPGTFRRRRGNVRIEYSRAPESADDRLIAGLEELPPEPVVVVTSDRGLQARAEPLGATIATSEQLLASLR